MKKERVLQLISNFYVDVGEGRENKDILGRFQYCCFGYFDALHEVDVGANNENDNYFLTEIVIKNLNGECSRRNLECFIEDEEKGKEFWEENKEAMLFISLIRIDRRRDKDLSKTKKAINYMNRERKDAIAYFSNDHGEVIVLTKGRSYQRGIKHILELHNSFSILKAYSIFAIKEEALESQKQIEKSVDEEWVDCRFHVSIKLTEQDEDSEIGKKEISVSEQERNERIKQFVSSLLKKLKDEKSGKKLLAGVYNCVLGSKDALIEIDNVSIWKLLACYRMGEILTHTNCEYGKAFYNIETELLIGKEQIDG